LPVPPVVTIPLFDGVINGPILNSSQSSTLGAPLCSLVRMFGGRSPLPVCRAIAASDNALVLVSKARRSGTRFGVEGPAAQESAEKTQTPSTSPSAR
jgi:hypothetical protein